MTLGESIARLRGERNMSQGDLAEALDVSRQSVSKWETNGSVPELGKLVQMSELFGVTLDELVKGQTAEKPAPEPPPVQTIIVERPARDTKKIVGVILLCFGGLVSFGLFLLSGALEGLLYGVCFLLCGVICLNAKKRAGLWCGWAAYLCVDLYLRYATGLTWRTIFFTMQWTPQQNYARLAIAWGQFLVMALLAVLTLRAYRAERYEPAKKRKAFLIAGWALYALRRLVPRLPLYRSARLRIVMELEAHGHYFLRALLFTVADYIFLALFVWLLVTTLGVWRWCRAQKNDG
ncbi:MAG: helix-turn-helix transcriptional regulator [Oscillospiraceae bacterium]|nr:helix-turn-helix transcriptional regulator [Oscillospiraceae bacterium]